MLKKNDKRRLYWLIDQFLSQKISGRIFCDEFYYSYNLEINDFDLSESEKRAFSELDKIASRYSEYDEDLQLDPNAFFSIEQLHQKVIETKEILKLQNPI